VHIHSFAEDNLKYDVLDLLIAGTETTVTTIQWAVLFLGQSSRSPGKHN
jgi:cytochrome P450